MKTIVTLFVTVFVCSTASAGDRGSVRALATKQMVVCNIGDGKEGSQEKVISAALIKAPQPTIDQEIGDFRLLAQWMPEGNVLSIGVIEKVSTLSASTLIREDKKIGSLFVSKTAQSIDLNCYIK